MQYKLISIDLDGTLLNDKHEIPQRNIEAIKKAQSQGIHVILSSGRAFLSMKEYIDILGVDFVSCGNGGTVYECKGEPTVLRELFFDMDIIQTILRDVNQYPNVLLCAQNNIFAKQMTDTLKRFSDISRAEPIITSLQDVTTNIVKMLLIGDHEKLVEQKVILDKYRDRASVFFSQDNMLEATSLDINKGSSLKFIANVLNIPLEQTIAIGDNFNDIEMLKAAGLGIAPQNAEDPVKEIADYVTSSSNIECAVADVIDKFF